ncbi:hypothetical protein E2C01_004327 [Portunus trituberculatus]|uniref:Uncharacterized protein n=1 Tax=Portunus trituberculatus TaxID=210409 RepID=A0A5B7CTR5_PORTR|nr:hypothetical protein [Portunus trituberculatus]
MLDKRGPFQAWEWWQRGTPTLYSNTTVTGRTGGGNRAAKRRARLRGLQGKAEPCVMTFIMQENETRRKLKSILRLSGIKTSQVAVDKSYSNIQELFPRLA